MLPVAIVTIGIMLPLPAQNNEHDQDLTVCLPDLDMPFSKKSTDTISNLRGFYHELAELLAAKLGKKLSAHYTLSGFHKRPVREGLLAGNCKLQFGLPASEGTEYVEGEVVLTHSITDIGYALVTGKNIQLTDPVHLKGKKVAVLTGSPPQMALSTMNQVKLDYCLFTEIALEKLERGDVDVAFIWGPEAGYLNKFRYHNKFQVISTNYEWPVAIGTAETDISLRSRINEVLKDLSTEIMSLRDKYGFPKGKKINIPGIRYDFND